MVAFLPIYAIFLVTHKDEVNMDKAKELIYASWSVLGQMSPYLLLGFLLSGILSVFISPRWVEKHLGSTRLGSIIKASLLGVPLPLCSCGVIPVSASLRKSGASKGATTAFLISTPQTGVDSILATYGLLGPFFAIFRPVIALLTGVIGGFIVSLIDPEDPAKATVTINAKDSSQPVLSWQEKLVAALKYGFVTLPGEISKPLIVGLLIAAVISTFVGGDFVSQYIGNYYVTMLLMLAIGIPIYVCSTSSIPLALGFMHMGVSPGAAFVFLISGPATNAAAISVVWKILGRKSAIVYLATVLFGSLAGGLAFDFLHTSFAMPEIIANHACHVQLSTVEVVSALIMLVVLAFSYYKAKIAPSSGSQCCSIGSEAAAGMVIHIDGMSCGNCVNAVTRAVLEIQGVSDVRISLHEKQALIYGSELSASEILAAINSLGYTATLKP